MTQEKVTWLASYPKSGNTWVRALLSAYQGGGYIDINNIDISVSDVAVHYYRTVSPLPIADLGWRGKQLIRPAALLHMVANTRGKRFAKTHFANVTARGLPQYIPPDFTERAIYIVRDPRDVVLSMAPFFGQSNKEMAEKMNQQEYHIGMEDRIMPSHLCTWSTHAASWGKEDGFPVHVVRYEDLLADTEGELAQMLEFCNVSVDPKRLSAAVKATQLAKLRKQEKQHGFKENDLSDSKRFFGKGGSRWQKELEPLVAQKIESDHRDVMSLFGYCEAQTHVGNT